jgi:hypothetical protein
MQDSYRPDVKPKVLVICSVPPRRPGVTEPQWLDLYEVIGETHRKYCEKWGYDYHLDISDIWEVFRPTEHGAQGNDAPIPIRYKIKFLLFQHFLDPDSCGKEYDQVVWLDADLLITNYNIQLEKFFNGHLASEEYQGGDIILTHDTNGLHATVIMMRRSPYSLGFAYANGEAGMRYFARDDWSDQLSMRMFLQTPPYSNMVHFHSVKSLCAMTPDTYLDIPKRAREIYEWKPNDFALHLSALPIWKRLEIAKRVVEEQELL